MKERRKPGTSGMQEIDIRANSKDAILNGRRSGSQRYAEQEEKEYDGTSYYEQEDGRTTISLSTEKAGQSNGMLTMNRKNLKSREMKPMNK